MAAEWTGQAEVLLKAIWAPELDPLFWRSDRGDVESAWHGHVPFAHWIVRALEPRCIVELGTHNGVSYAAFCRAAQREGIGTRCFAVDTWTGDEHAGFYGEEVFAGLRAYHDERFGAFSTLVRRTFDDALEFVPDGSVDLLHIDGRHDYDHVKHDFESWRGKLSNRGVVLFHDTNVRDHGFGVWRLWSELQQEFPGFEFLHGYGLGVLAVGSECPPLLAALTGLRDPYAIGAVRERFAQLGERCILEAQVRLLGKLGNEQARQHDAVLVRLGAAEAELGAAQSGLEDARSTLGEAEAAAASARTEAAQVRSDLAAAEQAAAEMQEQAQAQARDAARAEALGREQLARVEAARSRAEDAALQAGRERLTALAHDQQQRRSLEVAQAQAAAERTRAAEAQDAAAAAQKAHSVEAERRAGAEAALQQILHSGTWRATRPLRTGLSRVPASVRRPARNALQGIWRMVTPQLNALRRPILLAAPLAQPQLPAPATPALPQVQAAILAPPVRGMTVRGMTVCYISGEPDTPGTIYRVRRYADACSAIGANVTVLRLDEVALHVADAGRFDLVVIWRAVWTDELAAFIAEAQANDARIVFDVDDLMIDPALGVIEIIDGIRSQNVSEAAVQAHYAQVQRTMLAADYCSASTTELAQHMRRFGKTSFTLPNGFDDETFQVSRMAVRQRLAAQPDGLLRLGYASGSRTHQRDFAEVASILPSVLRAHPECRLVLFQANADVKLVDLHEFPDLEPFAAQIEWRDLVPLQRLPQEIARFDVNLAPLQLGNPFCEAKSELKYFEGALAGVCTVASPVGPYARAIQHGSNGFLASTPAQWEAILMQLLDDPALRRQAAQTALNEVLWTYGPDRRVQLMRHVVAEWQGGPAAADAFVLELGQRPGKPRPGPAVPGGEVVFSSDRLHPSDVTVAIPLYNYDHTLVETLDSVRGQTLQHLDLVIVDDGSTDQSLETALGWARANSERFNRLLVIRNHVNAGLGFTRNAAFSAAETPYVLPLDADNLLRPGCCELLLAAIRQSGAAFAYPVIQEFGGRNGQIGAAPYDPSRFVGGNYIDAMALVARSAWSAASGYAGMRLGWEDYDFWCAVAEAGLFGFALGGSPLADYRVHQSSMLAQVTDTQDVKHRVVAEIERRHPWVAVALPLAPKASVGAPAAAPPGLERLLPILRCPETGLRLRFSEGGLQSEDGSRSWPIKAGRPILFPGMAPETVAEYTHLSNEVPESALALIRAATGLVLNLSAGGTAERFDNVVEAEAAIFGHTDLVADSHALPFMDEAFDVVIAMNAFEHYRDPARAAAEIRRVLKPGGRVLIRTAFLQPQHEPPYHFYNVTRFGVAEWFSAFETEQLHVSDNFNPSYALAWMAHECQTALQRDAGSEAARLFAAEPIGRFAEFWTNPASRSHHTWRNFARLSQTSQEAVAAGFEYLGRRPLQH